MTVSDAALLTVRIASVAVVINCLEVLATHRVYNSSGIYSWDLIKTGYAFSTRGRVSRILDCICAYPNFFFLIATLLPVAFVLATNLFPHWRPALLTWVVFGWLFFVLRLQYGLDGSDQMLTIVLICMWIFYLIPGQMVRVATITFVGLQLILS